MNVVDSSGWLEFLAAGPNADFFEPALLATDELIVPTVCLYEVHKHVLRQRGRQDAVQAIALMRQGRIVSLDEGRALRAARISMELGLPTADAIMLATARWHRATLWTQDADFAGLDEVRYREWREQDE